MDLYTQSDLYCAAFDYPVTQDVHWALDTCTQLMGRMPRTVLEPMCGNARYAADFIGHGLHYCGFDRSRDMLDRADAHPMQDLFVADACDFERDGQCFDMAWCPINSIRHLHETKDLIRHLRCVARHLADDGLYLIETDVARKDGTKVDDQPIIWSTEQSDGTVIQASWRTIESNPDRSMVTELGRIERYRDGACMEMVETEYEMCLPTAAQWIDIASRAGCLLRKAGIRERGQWAGIHPMADPIGEQNEAVMLIFQPNQ